MKVTDRRLFTTDGELKDEFRHLENAEVPDVAARPVTEEESSAAPVKPAVEVPDAPDVPGYPAADSATQQPTFFDLVSMIAEPASIYLREASMGRSGELRAASQQEQNLQLARLHIDLLAVLRDKAAPQLDDRELATLDDLLVRLKSGFVQIQRG